MKYLQDSAHQGYPGANLKLGLRYEKGEGVERDVHVASKYFHREANKGHSEAQWLLSNMYAKGEGVEKNDKLALKYLQDSAHQGYLEANFLLGLRYEKGEGVEEDLHAAFKYYHIAADKGHSDAQVEVGTQYFQGEYLEKNNEAGLRYLRLAAKQNNVQALVLLGLQYCLGENVPQEYETAFQYLTSYPIRNYDASVEKEYLKDRNLAAVQSAFHMAGQMYEEGTGVEQNIKRAIHSYRCAAAHGSADAKFQVALLYMNGTPETPQDLDLASQYFALVTTQKIPTDEPGASNLRQLIAASLCKMGEIVEWQGEEAKKFGKPLREIEQESLTEQGLAAEDCCEDLSNLGKLRFEGWAIQDSYSSR